MERWQTLITAIMQWLRWPTPLPLYSGGTAPIRASRDGAGHGVTWAREGERACSSVCKRTRQALLRIGSPRTAIAEGGHTVRGSSAERSFCLRCAEPRQPIPNLTIAVARAFARLPRVSKGTKPQAYRPAQADRRTAP